MPNPYRRRFVYDPQLGEVVEIKMPTRASRRKATYPLKSEAVGVHPSQRLDAVQESIAAGVATDFTADGRAVFESQGHRKRFCESLGYFDKDGGYGDPRRR